MGESRTELVAWVNDLLGNVGVQKVEDCGKGGAYCQIIDSIFGDVPMSKVKMNANQEWQYLANFKVLQSVFKSKGIEKPIPVDRLVRCKMQDNLEFLQWLKKYWDLNFPGGEYDAVARRKGQGGAPEGGLRSTKSPVGTAPGRTSTTSTTAARRPVGTVPARTAGPRSASAVPDAQIAALTTQMNEMKVSVEGLEKERDFYFQKLRDIEIIIGARLESDDETMTEVEKEQLLQMQAILYSTEEGFEVPDAEEEVEEEETF
ncbi:hypothetical protein MNV49_003704 [Pseudohyphozyma bogoriensis]|nr:hypothetical protein MNV49_003704 [Pseudohyphozyma bogoriensis]